jgi:hypothetical protein
VSDKRLTTQNGSDHKKQYEISTDGHGRVTSHRRWRKQEADYGGDERLCGSELKPEAGTREGNDGGHEKEGILEGLGADLEVLRRTILRKEPNDDESQ